MASSEKYALRALKYQPIDYLITPFSLQELKIAINSLIRKSSNGLERPKALVNGHKNRISVLIGNTIRFIDVEEILFCESCGNHSVFHFLNANKIKAKNHIGYFEELLPNDTFFRIHRKYLVNLFHIKSLLRKNGLHCELPNDTFLTVSRRKRDQLLHKVHFRTLSDVTPSK